MYNFYLVVCGYRRWWCVMAGMLLLILKRMAIVDIEEVVVAVQLCV